MKAFVTVGFERMPFDRLIRGIDDLVMEGILSETTLVQRGHTPYVPEHCRCVNFLNFEEMVSAIQECDVVISHAGVGTILLCHDLGFRPIVVPRRGDLREHVDNHQMEFGRVMSAEQIVFLAEHTKFLGEMLANKDLRFMCDTVSHAEDGSPLCNHLHRLLNEELVVEETL